MSNISFEYLRCEAAPTKDCAGVDRLGKPVGQPHNERVGSVAHWLGMETLWIWPRQTEPELMWPGRALLRSVALATVYEVLVAVRF